MNVFSLGTYDTPFQGLLVANAKLEDLRTKILVDNAAEMIFINDDFCNDNVIPVRYVLESAAMGNHAEQHLEETSKPILVQIGGYTTKLRIAVSPPRYQTILAKQLLASHYADLDCFTHEEVIKHRNKEYCFIADEPNESPQVSFNILTNDHQKLFPLSAVILLTKDHANDVPSEAMLEPKRDVLYKYRDLFFEDSSHGPPPRRAHDFHIEL